MMPQIYIPNKLQGIVDVIHEQRSPGIGKWKFLPDGKVELMFRIGEGTGMSMKNSRFPDERDSPGQNFCILAGFCTKPVEISFENMHFINIQMNPIALKALFGIPAYELKDFAIAGDLIIPELAEIEDKINELPDFMSRAKWLEGHVISKIKETSDLHMAMGILNLTQKLSQKNFTYPVKKVDDLLGYSKTQSYRIFNNWFGLSTGKYQRMMQFTHSMNTIHSSEASASLTELGFQLGYYDQAHFIRSFKEFAGITPGKYKKIRTPIPGQLII
jgi:AraC-like DNA-binding protein